jgi:hypothetical protein
MTASRSWKPLLRPLLAALLASTLAAGYGAGAADARRNVDLGAETGEPAPAPPPASTPPAEAEGGETTTPKARRGRSGSCAVTLEAPRHLIAGEAPAVSGRLTCAEAGEAGGVAVQIFERSAGTPGFAAAATVLSEADGSFAATLEPAQANVLLYARAGRARSPRQAIHVAPLVTLAGPARGAVLPLARHHGARTPVTFSGTVSPSDAGAVVALQRERPTGSGSWRRVAVTRVGDDGHFSFSHLFRTPGPIVLRAFVHRHAHHLPAVSEALSYAVAQADNPSLTISLSPQTVALGGAVTISGKLAGSAGDPVTLLARSAGGGFSPVASTTTEAGGAYSFTQTPAQDTVYRVSSGAQRSMPLRAQVTLALTAVPSASTVQAGEGVTISGTVVPASPGARVYLQHAAPAGVGFQTLGYATVDAGSQYAIAVPPAGPGSAVYRVQIPRLGALHGTVSQPITIVTTASAE